MSQLQYEFGAINVGASHWEELEALMADAAKELGQAPVSGLAPGVQGAASAFLSAWAGFAEESRAMANGFAGALRAAAADMGGTDQSQSGQYDSLDGRMGPGQ